MVEAGDRIELEKVTLTTPGCSRVLQRNLSLEVTEGQLLLLTGPTGIGKTSLMRMIAGLWKFGSGRILRHHAERSCSCRKSHI